MKRPREAAPASPRSSPNPPPKTHRRRSKPHPRPKSAPHPPPPDPKPQDSAPTPTEEEEEVALAPPLGDVLRELSGWWWGWDSLFVEEHLHFLPCFENRGGGVNGGVNGDNGVGIGWWWEEEEEEDEEYEDIWRIKHIHEVPN